MSDDRSTDDDVEHWQRVRDADAETGVEPAGVDPGVKTDPDDVREWAEERDAVPVTDPEVDGPEAYALRHENVIEGSAHERVSWQDFAAAFRGETGDERLEFHHHDDDEAGTHRFVSRSGTESEDRGDAVRADGDRSGSGSDSDSDDAEVDIGGGGTEAGSDHDAATADDAEGTVVGDREGGIESGAEEEADADAATDADTATTDATADDADDAGTAVADEDWSLDDVSEGDSVVDSQGETVGIVTAVEADRLYVDPDPGITEKLSAKLGWVDEDDAEYTVDADDVAGVEDGDVHLEPVAL